MGNLKGRYIGCKTDENLCSLGIEEIRKKQYPKAELVYASPMKRCLETAALIYPKLSVETNIQLKECDFGKFENKNYQELSSVKEYQEWIEHCLFQTEKGWKNFEKDVLKALKNVF